MANDAWDEIMSVHSARKPVPSEKDSFVNVLGLRPTREKRAAICGKYLFPARLHKKL
ncbi:unnamed protein product [Gongylonema pulchrum]|uniref:Transposase n=1 Tax=Gongylonema pulchrum TaxID=637853 RepID=A0A183F1R7_9BILA|nr:unnamed protein product [Gongylonema pulchrum]